MQADIGFAWKHPPTHMHVVVIHYWNSHQMAPYSAFSQTDTVQAIRVHTVTLSVLVMVPASASSRRQETGELLAGSLACVVPGPVQSRPLCFLAGSTRVACVFSIEFFECVGFSYIVLDLVCSLTNHLAKYLNKCVQMMPMSRSQSPQRPVASGPVNL